jgi:membrane protein implicated in regulation of membrane protease activity
MALLISILLAFFVPYPWNILVVIGGASIEVLEVIWGRRLAKRWRPQTGAEAMIGEHAVVVTACRPTGQVRINSELWEATCAAGADVGDETVVRSIDGLTLIVEPAPAAEAHPVGTI